MGKKRQNSNEPLSMATNGNGSQSGNMVEGGRNAIMMIKVSGHDDSGKVGRKGMAVGIGGKVGNLNFLPPSSFKESPSNLATENGSKCIVGEEGEKG